MRIVKINSHRMERDASPADFPKFIILTTRQSGYWRSQGVISDLNRAGLASLSIR